MSDATEHHHIGQLISTIEHQKFAHSLADWLRSNVFCDIMTMVVYCSDQRPVHLFDDFRHQTARDGMMRYLDQTYLLNAFFQRHQTGLASGVYRIRDLAPDHYLESAIHKGYEVIITEQEEIGYVTEGWPQGLEEVDIAVVLDAVSTAEIGLYRKTESGAFTTTELNRLNSLMPVIEAAFRRHWQYLQATTKITSARQTRWTQQTSNSFAKSLLSEREREVMLFVLRGHSSESIASHLNISITTVKTHRKRAYDKLNISTQAELLALFLQHMENCFTGSV